MRPSSYIIIILVSIWYYSKQINYAVSANNNAAGTPLYTQNNNIM